MNNKIFRETLFAFSLANILFAGNWRIFLYPPTFDYHIKTGPGRLDYLGILLGVIITALMFLGCFRLFKYFYKEKANLLINLTFFALFLLGLNIVRLQMPYSSMTFSIAAAFQILSLVLLAITVTKWRNQVFNTAKIIVLTLSPFILITFSQAILGIVNYAPPENEISVLEQLARIQPKPKENIKNRVVWIVFDEFDYRIAFDMKAVEMPEFERLKNLSLTATNAVSPAYNTLEAIPSLLTGKKITESHPKGSSELILNFSNGEQGKFSETPNVFTDVKSIGGDTAVNGFYHSYCRTIGQQLSVCKWVGEIFKPTESVIDSLLNNYNILTSQIMLAFTADSTQLKQTFDGRFEEDELQIKEMVEDRSTRLDDVYRIATDPKIDLAFIHLPMPHPPSRYMRLTKEYNPGLQDYVNNLALTDLILGEIRKRMEDQGQWDSSTIIVSTDHQLRVNRWKETDNMMTTNDRQLTGEKEDPRIPFFVKMKNQKESLVYEKPFNTVVTRELINEIIKGEISTPEELANRLDGFANSH